MTSYFRKGSGEPVVLVHGLGSRWEVWEPVIDQLAEHRDVIAVDLPGFGLTPADPQVVPGAVGYAQWLTGFLEELGIERPHVVGNSMGGGVAIEAGRAGVAGRVTAFSPIGFWGRPGRLWTQGLLTGVRALATHAAPVVDRLSSVKHTRSATLAVLFGQPGNVSQEEAARHVEGLVAGASFPAARDSFSTYSLEVGDDFGKLGDIPVTIAWGTRDLTLIHRTQSAKARRVLPNARHLDLSRCGHLPFSDDPDLCARVILEDHA